MDVLEIVRLYLIENEYDGLYNVGECACKHDELAPCGEMEQDCIPGYLTPCDCGEHDWHIASREVRDEAARTRKP